VFVAPLPRPTSSFFFGVISAKKRVRRRCVEKNWRRSPSDSRAGSCVENYSFQTIWKRNTVPQQHWRVLWTLGCLLVRRVSHVVGFVSDDVISDWRSHDNSSSSSRVWSAFLIQLFHVELRLVSYERREGESSSYVYSVKPRVRVWRTTWRPVRRSGWVFGIKPHFTFVKLTSPV
jgi:hypothetical protein